MCYHITFDIVRFSGDVVVMNNYFWLWTVLHSSQKEKKSQEKREFQKLSV